jgi:hypothetical protein
MSRARVSIVIYGFYMAIGGLSMLLIPNLVLPLAGIPFDHGFWVRFAGLLCFVVGAKAIQNSAAEIPFVFRFDNFTRTFAATTMVILVVTGIAPKIILVLASLDYGSSIWTELALRADKRNPVRIAAA